MLVAKSPKPYASPATGPPVARPSKPDIPDWIPTSFATCLPTPSLAKYLPANFAIPPNILFILYYLYFIRTIFGFAPRGVCFLLVLF